MFTRFCAGVQVPVPCNPKYGEFMALRWLVQSAVDKEATMRLHDALATEILQAYRREVRSACAFSSSILRSTVWMHHTAYLLY